MRNDRSARQPLLAVLAVALLGACGGPEENISQTHESGDWSYHVCISGNKVEQIDFEGPLPPGESTGVVVSFSDANGQNVGSTNVSGGTISGDEREYDVNIPVPPTATSIEFKFCQNVGPPGGGFPPTCTTLKKELKNAQGAAATMADVITDPSIAFTVAETFGDIPSGGVPREVATYEISLDNIVGTERRVKRAEYTYLNMTVSQFSKFVLVAGSDIDEDGTIEANEYRAISTATATNGGIVQVSDNVRMRISNMDILASDTSFGVCVVFESGARVRSVCGVTGQVATAELDDFISGL